MFAYCRAVTRNQPASKITSDWIVDCLLSLIARCVTVVLLAMTLRVISKKNTWVPTQETPDGLYEPNGRASVFGSRRENRRGSAWIDAIGGVR